MAREIQKAGKLAVQVGGASGVAMAIAGGSTAAASAATVIAATGGAAAVVLAGVGVYKLLSESGKKNGSK